MLGIKIKGVFASLYDNTSLTFEMAHPLGLVSEDAELIPGGFSFPINIPLDEINIGIVGRADRLDNDTTLLKDEYCEVWIDGVLLYVGKATLKKANNKSASLFMVFNELKDITDVNLPEIDFEGPRTFGADQATREALALDTANNPLDHDFVFCPVFNPVYNPVWYEGVTGAQQKYFQNFYSSDDDAFIELSRTAITPFIRVDYLLSRIFAHQGYVLDNQFQASDELKKLLLYNNYNINRHTLPAVSSWDEQIDLKNHVPFRPAVDLVKAFIGTYALGLYYDNIDKTVLLIPFADLIAGPVVSDWTDRAAADFEYIDDKDFVSTWRYGLDENDELSVKYSLLEAPPGFTMDSPGPSARELFADTDLFFQYAKADNTVYFIHPVTFKADYIAEYFAPVKKTGSIKKYTSELIPLWNSSDLQTDGIVNTDLPIQQVQVPQIRHNGLVDENSYDANTRCTSFRLMLYRGFQPADVGLSFTYPMAGSTAYNIRGESVGEYSLLMDGEKGVYAKFWRLPYEMLKNKKEVSRELLLSVRDIVNFRFWHKIRIENQNYFITSLRFSVSNRGISPISAKMITSL